MTTQATRGGEPPAFIGVDVGGTHTDVEVVMGDEVVRGKALTTYDDFSRGVLEAIGVAAAPLSLSTNELLERTRLLINGTTVVTNAIAQLRGSRVGVLVTEGFKDTFRIAGGPRLPVMDDHLQANVPDLVDRRALSEIRGRIDYAGRELVPLDEEAVRREVGRLVEQLRVESLAICFLSSYVNPAQEERAGEIVAELYPDLYVTLSNRAYRVQGENRRWTTAVLNSFVHGDAEVYLQTLSTRLQHAGLRGGLAFFQGLGGGISRERAARFPLALLGSGPAGGAIGANALAKRLGAKDVLIADMGGTSLDVGLIRNNEVHIEKKIDLGLFQTGVNLVDVISIGAGGGSIAWVSERGVPMVGPHSAGSTPGPACYGKGGEQPTVTDAMVAMGFIDPDNYLGGRLTLRKDLAQEVLSRELGDRFGWSVLESAAAVHDLVVTNMAHAMREVSVQKGHDPRNFLFLAYGGTLPLFACQIAAVVGIQEIVIPRNSSVFCAKGVLASDFVLRYDRTVGLNLAKPDHIEDVSKIADEMVATAIADMGAEGFADEDIHVARSGDFRFLGQVYELSLPLPDRALTEQDAPRLSEEFLERYEEVYGQGTAWKGVPAMLLTYTVTVTGRRPSQGDQLHPAGAAEPEGLRKAEREVYLPSLRATATLPIYDGGRFEVGVSVDGPAIIDETDTTIYVPPGVTARRDEHLNYRLSRGGKS